jgi:MFS family permease
MVFVLSSVLSIGSALLITFGSREVRPEVIPVGPVLRLAGTAVRGVLADPIVRRLFAVYGVVFLANQMSRPYTPLLVEHLVGPGTGLASSIGLVVSFASLVGALVSPAVGWLGDRAGFRPVLIAALLAGSVASLAMPAAPVLGALAAVAVLLGAAVAAVGAMVFSLLATEVPPERRSATLNLVYLPLYISGIVGPAIGGVVASVVGAAGPFIAGSMVFLMGAVAVTASGSRPPPAEVPNPGDVR